MTKKTKGLILLLSFAVFFILSFLMILFAYGYQFDLKEFKWVKTGTILIKANIDNAEVSINDRLVGKISLLSNTLTKKNILPGKYRVQIQSDESELTKNIEVRSGEVAQLIHIFLPRQKDEEKIISLLNNQPVQEEIPYFINKKDGLLYKKTDDGETEKVFPEPVSNFALSPDKKKLIIAGGNEIYVLWLKDENEWPFFKKDHRELVLRISQKIEKTSWLETNWHLVYTTDSGEIHLLEIDGTGGRNDLVI